MGRGGIKFMYQGEMLCIAEISRRTNVTRETLLYRLNQGMSMEDAINTPVQSYRPRNEQCETFPDCFHCPYADCIMSVEPKTHGTSIRKSGSMVIPYKRKRVSRKLKKGYWYYMTEEDIAKIKRERCRKCGYFAVNGNYCNYFTATGHRRGCRPDQCTHYLDPVKVEAEGESNEAVINL